MKVRRMRCPKCKSLETVKNGSPKLLSFGFERKSVKKYNGINIKSAVKDLSIESTTNRGTTVNLR